MLIKKNIIKWNFSLRYVIPIILIMIGFYFLSIPYYKTPFAIKEWPWLLIVLGTTWLAMEFKK